MSTSARSHPEHAEARLWDRRMEGGLDAHGEDAARVERIDDAVVPEAGRREVWRAFAFVGLEDGRLEGVAFLVRREAAADGRQDPRRLRAAHDGDPRVGPRPQEPGLVGTAGHRVVPGTEAAADQDRELRDLGGGDGRHQLRPVLRDPGFLVLAADHEPRDVLEEDQRDAALAGELDEVRALQGRLAEEDPIVGDDPYRVAGDVPETGDE